MSQKSGQRRLCEVGVTDATEVAKNCLLFSFLCSMLIMAINIDNHSL